MLRNVAHCFHAAGLPKSPSSTTMIAAISWSLSDASCSMRAAVDVPVSQIAIVVDIEAVISFIVESLHSADFCFCVFSGRVWALLMVVIVVRIAVVDIRYRMATLPTWLSVQ